MGSAPPPSPCWLLLSRAPPRVRLLQPKHREETSRFVLIVHFLCISCSTSPCWLLLSRATPRVRLLQIREQKSNCWEERIWAWLLLSRAPPRVCLLQPKQRENKESCMCILSGQQRGKKTGLCGCVFVQSQWRLYAFVSVAVPRLLHAQTYCLVQMHIHEIDKPDSLNP